MENEITIRRAEGKDLKDILRLTAALYKVEYKEYGIDWDQDWICGKGKKIISESINDKDSFIVVAESNGKIIAFLRGSLYWDDWMSWKSGKGAELWDIFIEEGFRNQKIGGKSMKLFLDWCKTKKVNYILANVAERNAEAIKFYKNLGFDGHQIIMEKKLNSGQ